MTLYKLYKRRLCHTFFLVLVQTPSSCRQSSTTTLGLNPNIWTIEFIFSVFIFIFLLETVIRKHWLTGNNRFSKENQVLEISLESSFFIAGLFFWKSFFAAGKRMEEESVGEVSSCGSHLWFSTLLFWTLIPVQIGRAHV